MHYFFYGTLLDPVVRREVLRRDISRGHLCRAVLAGYRRVYRIGATYPVLVPEPTGRVEGLLVRGLNVRDAARLATYEGPEYGLFKTAVRADDGSVVSARTFLPRRMGLGSSEEWCFEDWQRRFAETFRAQVTRRRQAPLPLVR